MEILIRTEKSWTASSLDKQTEEADRAKIIIPHKNIFWGGRDNKNDINNIFIYINPHHAYGGRILVYNFMDMHTNHTEVIGGQ